MFDLVYDTFSNQKKSATPYPHLVWGLDLALVQCGDDDGSKL